MIAITQSPNQPAVDARYSEDGEVLIALHSSTLGSIINCLDLASVLDKQHF